MGLQKWMQTTHGSLFLDPILITWKLQKDVNNQSVTFGLDFNIHILKTESYYYHFEKHFQYTEFPIKKVQNTHLFLYTVN